MPTQRPTALKKPSKSEELYKSAFRKSRFSKKLAAHLKRDQDERTAVAPAKAPDNVLFTQEHPYKFALATFYSHLPRFLKAPLSFLYFSLKDIVHSLTRSCKP